MNKLAYYMSAFAVVACGLLLIPFAQKEQTTQKVQAVSEIQKPETATMISDVAATQIAQIDPLQDTRDQLATIAVPLGQPSGISIPKLGISAPIVAMGLESDGKMDVPNNFTEVSWYRFGSMPGQIGNAVLGAHVDNGHGTPGVFKNLKNAQTGDDIFITDKNNNVLHYKVTGSKVYNRNETDTGAVFGQTQKSQLNLITCFGTWLPKENTYDKRIVVTAELVG